MKSLLKACATAVLLTSAVTTFAEGVNMIPAPQQWTGNNETVTISEVKFVSPKGKVGLLPKLLPYFKKELASLGVKVNNAADFAISFNYIDDAKLKKEGYLLTISKKGITISANDYPGLLYGTRSLLQLLSTADKKGELPTGKMTDFPEYKLRMLMLDTARKFIPFEELKDYVRALAWVKMNELHLHLNDNSFGKYPGYRLPSAYEGLTSRDGHYSWKQIRELQDLGYIYGVTIVPEIASPGHAYAFVNFKPELKMMNPELGNQYLDIENPETYKVIETVLAEVAKHFDSKDIHIGTDEYRLGRVKDKKRRNELGEKFRCYINHFNKYLNSLGKTCRIWSGYEHMPGTTQPDTNVVIDMWVTGDAKNKLKAGYKIINSSHYFTYIVPGAPYYGVNDSFVYNKWTPERFSNKSANNPEKGHPNLLGSCLHVWNDQGPTGYTTSEIARLALPSMFTFSEKMWGTKGFENYKKFMPLRNKLLRIPLVSLLDRNFEKRRVILKAEDINLAGNKSVPVKADYNGDNLEYPWTVTMTVKRTGKSAGSEVLLSSKLATIYADLEHTYEKKDRKTKKKIKTVKRGIGIVRANKDAGETPIKSLRPYIMVFDCKLPVNKTVEIKIVGKRKRTTVYVDGKQVGSYGKQSLCPLKNYGSENGNSFNGVINSIEIKNSAR